LKRPLLKFLLSGVSIFFLPFLTWAQFPPPAGQQSSTAIYKDSTIIVNWAKTCSIQVGYIDIADTSLYYAGSNKANYGVEDDAIGKSDDHIVSLGDGGIATLSFDPPIINGNGFDFAVFENGLGDNFLELGFVEVSSDGIRFVRFRATSLTPESPQIGTFGFLDATKINNLAGKYRVFFGTPFDLDEIKDSSGLDIMHITQVRIIDVVGCITTPYATFDSQGHKINDPRPTPFNTGGFDLDAVGVIHESSQSVNENQKHLIQIYPNPCQELIHLTIPTGNPVIFRLINLMGQIVASERLVVSTVMDMTEFDQGVFIGQFTFPDGRMETHKIIKQ
jgi:hypothetical protein